MSDNMNTYTGKKFNPVNMKTEDVSVRDIAHALSLVCRGSGHVKHFYSVGQHCLNCAKEALARGWSDRVVFACLMHDASEAYISDIIRPVKKYLNNYAEIENHILDTIFEAVGIGALTAEERRMVRQIDDELLDYDLKYLLDAELDHPLPKVEREPDESLRSCDEIENEFMELAEKLYKTVRRKTEEVKE